MTRIPPQRRPWILAVLAGSLYGVAIRLSFGNSSGGAWAFGWYPNVLWVMSAGFLIFVPLAMGYMVTALTPSDGRYHWAQWAFTPWLAMLLADVIVLISGLEGLICLIFAVPITLIVASIGGIVQRSRFQHKGTATICLAIFPLLLSAVEMQQNAPLQTRTVETSILIHAPVPTVWRNIERVRAISPAELDPTWAHRIGFPLPVEATLDHEGVGGVRNASFAGGLTFFETITDWQPDRRISFTIKADTAHIPPGTLDEHVTIGGRFFDVLNGTYELHPRPDGSILLRLSSQERLSTDFNPYAALWSDFIMRDLQNSILQVIQHRCQAEAAASHTLP